MSAKAAKTVKDFSSIQLGGVTWELIWMPQDNYIDEKSMGSCNRVACRIRVVEHHRDGELDTLLHEILHAVMFQAGMAGDNEEQAVERLTPWLLAAIAQNPDLFIAIASHYK
jgi:RecB family endonuclease NucS